MRCRSFHLLPIIALFCFVLSGCGTVQTIYPIRTSDKTIRDPGIEGVWDSQLDDPRFSNASLKESVLTIKRVGGKRYHVTFREGHTTYEGHAYLVELGERQFLEFDLESIARQGEASTRPMNSLENSINTLFFARIHRKGDQMRFGFPRVEEFKLAAQSSDDLIGFERGKSFIITSTTEQLQRFLATADDSMYQSAEFFLRSKESPEPKALRNTK